MHGTSAVRGTSPVTSMAATARLTAMPQRARYRSPSPPLWNSGVSRQTGQVASQKVSKDAICGDNSAEASAIQSAMAPGDVLFVKGTGGLTEIGTTGGFLGHFLVVLASPIRLLPSSPEALELAKLKPCLDLARVWKVETIESTRSREGLHRAEMLVHIEQRTGRFLFVGELFGDDLSEMDDEIVQLWQSPTEFRSQIRKDFIFGVLSEMKSCEKNWSLATAARAVLMNAAVREDDRKGRLLKELCECWSEAPICTSIVVVFWQRLLCRVASQSKQAPLDAILRVMPLKADRGLPGDLINAMSQCGWAQLNHVPCAM